MGNAYEAENTYLWIITLPKILAEQPIALWIAVAANRHLVRPCLTFRHEPAPGGQGISPPCEQLRRTAGLRLFRFQRRSDLRV